jgi:hypothetical protein
MESGHVRVIANSYSAFRTGTLALALIPVTTPNPQPATPLALGLALGSPPVRSGSRVRETASQLPNPQSPEAQSPKPKLYVGRISWLRRVRLENP